MSNGLMELFKSKRFWSAIVGVVMMFIIAIFPELEANNSIITEALLIFIGLLIGGYTVVDAVNAARGKPSKYDI